MSRKEFASSIGTLNWPKFDAILDAIDSGTKEISIRSANGIGKTHLLAVLVAYELATAREWVGDVAPPSLKIICTGATYTQLHVSLWPEIKRTLRATKLPTKNKAGEISLSPNQVCIAINPGKIESGQGMHADRIVVLIDEASGFTRAMINALTSNATGENSLIVATYNPIDTESAMYEVENEHVWSQFSISAFDHPNVKSGVEEIKGAVTRESVVRRLRMDSIECPKTTPDAIHTFWDNKYYQPTPEAKARVCGEWSLGAMHGFIPMSELLFCCKDNTITHKGDRIMGLDVSARGDDRTAMTWFNGNEQMAYDTLQTAEYELIGSWVENHVLENNITAVCIDDTGVGNAVTVRLQQSKHIPDCKIIPVNFAQSPKGFMRERKPHNARAEMYMLLEGDVRSQGIKLLYKPDALKEIAAARFVNSGGKGSDTIRLEDKNLIKRRLGRSPDLADATALARYAPRLLARLNRPLIY